MNYLALCHESPRSETDCMRVTCFNCGKLLFKLFPGRADGSSHHEQEIEIKCYNCKCKAINKIKI